VLVKPERRDYLRRMADSSMINRGEILWLGISSAVTGCLVGGLMLGIGMNLIVGGQNLGWLLLLPAAPVSALPGWIMGRRLAGQLKR
jgi:hypothetical protein